MNDKGLTPQATGLSAALRAQVEFTPGPWRAEFTDVPYEELEGGAWTVEQDGNSICTCDGPADTNEANARLIAAAPEMFEALAQEAARRNEILNLIARHHDGEFGVSALEHFITGLMTGSEATDAFARTTAALSKATGNASSEKEGA